MIYNSHYDIIKTTEKETQAILKRVEETFAYIWAENIDFICYLMNFIYENTYIKGQSKGFDTFYYFKTNFIKVFLHASMLRFKIFA